MSGSKNDSWEISEMQEREDKKISQILRQSNHDSPTLTNVHVLLLCPKL